LPTNALYGDAEACQQVQRDLDIGPGDQFADHFNRDVTAGHQGQCQQQGGQELAGHIAAHLDGHVQRELAGAHAQRRKAWLAQIVDGTAQLAQGIDQVANRALMHARHARQLKITAQQGQRRGQRAHGRAGIAQIQDRTRHRQLTAQPVDHSDVAALLDLAAELLERGQHDSGVV